MKIDYQKFEHNNWDEFVHVRALMDLLKNVAEEDIGSDNIQSIDKTGITTDDNGNPVYHVTYTDKNGQSQQKTIPLSSLTASVRMPYIAETETQAKNIRILADIPQGGKMPQAYDLTGELANGNTYHIPIYQTSIVSNMSDESDTLEPVTALNIISDGVSGTELGVNSASGKDHTFVLGQPISFKSTNNSDNLNRIKLDTNNKVLSFIMADGSTVSITFGSDVTIDDPQQ